MHEASPAAGGDKAMIVPVRARVIDLGTRTRLPILIEMVQAVSRAQNPSDVQANFGRGMRRLRGIDGYLAASVRGLPRGTYKVTRKLLHGVEGDPDVPNPWRDWDSLPLSRGGVLGSIIARGLPAALQELEAPNDPVLADALAPFGSIMAIPLYDGGEILNWSFFLSRRRDWFNAGDVEEFLVSTNLVGGTVRNVIANQRLHEADLRKTREIDRIATIQRSLLPQPLPMIPGAALGAHYATFDRAGGDLYAVRKVNVRGADAPQWLMLIADASGHGPSAAVVSAMVDSIVATIAEPIHGPGPILETINRYLCSRSIEHSFVTAFLGLYDPESRELRYANAGHNPPLVRTPTDGPEVAGEQSNVRFLDIAGDMPLGIDPDIRYLEAIEPLSSGETLVLYTDGIVEARNPNGAFFGVDRIEAALRHCSGAPECAVQSINESLREFEGGVRPADDQTLLVMQLTP